jgi:hypothetical protein
MVSVVPRARTPADHGRTAVDSIQPSILGAQSITGQHDLIELGVTDGILALLHVCTGIMIGSV